MYCLWFIKLESLISLPDGCVFQGEYVLMARVGCSTESKATADHLPALAQSLQPSLLQLNGVGGLPSASNRRHGHTMRPFEGAGLGRGDGGMTDWACCLQLNPALALPEVHQHVLLHAKGPHPPSSPRALFTMSWHCSPHLRLSCTKTKMVRVFFTSKLSELPKEKSGGKSYFLNRLNFITKHFFVLMTSLFKTVNW